jgi:hypothetical protein
MESTQTPPNTFGITSSTLLDTSYLDSLFSNDPDEVTQITEESPQSAPAQTDKQSPAKNPTENPAPPPVVTTIEDPNFLDKLDDLDNEEVQPTAKPTPPPAAAPQPTSPLQEKGNEQPTATNYLTANISAFGKELYDIGILTDEEQQEPELITSPEQLVEKLKQEKQRGAVQILENILSNFGPEYRQAFDAIYLEGVRPSDYFGQVEQIAALQDLDLSNIENQRQVLRTHYQSLGWDAAKISAKIEKLENYQDIEEEARDVHAVLIAREKQGLEQKTVERKQELARKASLEQQQQQAISRIIAEKTKAKDFDGIPFDDKTARLLSGYMLEKKWQLGENQISDFEKEILDLARPENRDLQVKIALLMHLLKTDPTLGRLQKKAVTKETEKIFSFLQREESTDKKLNRKKNNFIDD